MDEYNLLLKSNENVIEKNQHLIRTEIKTKITACNDKEKNKIENKLKKLKKEIHAIESKININS